ncbi:hypothetical protein GJ689_01265 [Rhodoplanes serenus]|uniref:Uncharacterized protein n=1 Tax=Rhodoplanes serenus TaxID=200615 RepID=A0A9X4XGS5_9BRAD|nr:hypothetical protein [Rhodoplanes serenus]MTW14847.1 hypothetical protein [Rhodoplanes serenus]
MQSFDEVVAEFLSRPKLMLHQPKWQQKAHPDFAAAGAKVVVSGSNAIVGRLVMTAHVLRVPRKYGFALIFRGKRVFALDVNPGRSHRNLLTKGAVSETHWQCWPAMEAEADGRDLMFAGWLNCFLLRARISGRFPIKPPPHRGQGVQLRLFNGD